MPTNWMTHSKLTPWNKWRAQRSPALQVLDTNWMAFEQMEPIVFCSDSKNAERESENSSVSMKKPRAEKTKYDSCRLQYRICIQRNE